MAVVALQIVGALALKLYEVVHTVSANRTQCGVIGDRVSRIMTEVERLDPNKHEMLFKKGVFGNFQSTLESAVDLCSEFVNKSNFRRWFAYNSDNEKFDEIVVRLDQANQDLQLSLAFDTSTWQQAQQTDISTMIDLLEELVQKQREQSSLLGGLFDGQLNIMEAFAEMKLNFAQGASNPTESHPWSLNSRQIKFDRIKDEDEDLWNKADPVGIGSFGTVYRGVFREEAVAIKSVNFDSTKAQGDFMKEVNILFMLHHPNITTFHGAVLKPKKGDMVLELFDRSLADALHIHGRAKLTADEKLAIINDITSAMQYLHSTNPKIIHSDLKPANVMISKRGVAKIIDFGLSATKSSSRTSRTKVGTAGTTPYQPLELHQPPHLGDHTVDIYAFGITVNEIFAEEAPFADVSAAQIAHEIRQGKRPPIATTLPPHLRRIVDGCLQTKPSSRPEFLEIYLHLYQHSNQKPSLIPPHNSSDRTSPEKPPLLPKPSLDRQIIRQPNRPGSALYEAKAKAITKVHSLPMSPQPSPGVDVDRRQPKAQVSHRPISYTQQQQQPPGWAQYRLRSNTNPADLPTRPVSGGLQPQPPPVWARNGLKSNTGDRAPRPVSGGPQPQPPPPWARNGLKSNTVDLPTRPVSGVPQPQPPPAWARNGLKSNTGDLPPRLISCRSPPQPRPSSAQNDLISNTGVSPPPIPATGEVPKSDTV